MEEIRLGRISLFFKIRGRSLKDLISHADESDQVGDCHQSAEYICKAPDCVGGHKAAAEKHRQKRDPKPAYAASMAGEKIAQTLLSVKAPADDGGEPEKEKSEEI